MTTGATASACAQALKAGGRAVGGAVDAGARGPALCHWRVTLKGRELFEMASLNRLQKPVLVLNASYEPINICAARRALVLVLKGVASAEEVSSQVVHSSRRSVQLPSRDPAAGIPPHSAPDARFVAQEHPDARPLHVPVLPSDDALRRVDAGSRDSALARRANRRGRTWWPAAIPAITGRAAARRKKPA